MLNELHILFLTIIGSIIISFSFTQPQNNFIKLQNVKIGTLLTLLIQLIVIIIWLNYDPFLIVNDYNNGFQYFSILHYNFTLGISLSLGIDGISLLFILLTVFIFSLSIIFVMQLRRLHAFFIIILLILEFLLIVVFTVLDLFFFYVAFESSLIPMFLIIGIWGSRSRKIKAAFYLFIYTMATALLTLFAIFYIINQVGSTFYPDLLNYNFSQDEQLLLWLVLFLTFATKIPVIPLHIWLPEAHVEAPTIGSVILASILLKLGGYGFLRFLLPLFPFATTYYLPLVFTIGICSVIYASLTTIRQIDLKRVIAYSSIAHMNMVVLGLFSNNQTGIEGGIYLMLGHGIVSTALFLLAGVVYDRYHTRLIRYYGGLIQVMPLFGIFFFLFILGNIGFPGTSNFIGEILITVGVFERNPFIAVLIGGGIILSAVYSLWLYNRIFFGTLKTNYIKNFIDINYSEFIIFIPLVLLMFLFGVNSNLILDISCLNIQNLLIYSINI